MKNLFFILAATLGLSVQAQIYQWARAIVSPVFGNEPNYIRSTATDAAGNVYVTGNFKGPSVNFNPGGTPLILSSSVSGLGEDIFFAKYSAAGICAWVKHIVGGYGASIRIGPGGDIYLTGVFGGTNVDFDPGPGTANLNSTPGSGPMFIARYDPNGNYIWAKGIGGGGNDWPRDLGTDAAGNVYIIGLFQSSTADFDPGPGVASLISVGNSDVFFAKYDGSGNYLWAKSIGSGGNDKGNSISLDATGNVYICGDFQGSATDFDPGVGTATLNASGVSAFFAKYDGSGNYLWAKPLLNGSGADIRVDPAGVYLTGGFSGAITDFDPGPSTATLSSGASWATFLAKYDHSGNYLWAEAVLGATSQHMALSAQGKIYVIGGFVGTVDFDPGPGTANVSSTGSTEVFFAKYDANGKYVWARPLSNPTGSGDRGPAIAVDASENVFIGGYFIGTVDFDTGPGIDTLSGYKAMFLAKYDYCGQQVTNPQHICTGQSYVVNENVYTSSGTYTNTLYTLFGCDSVVVTQLTVSGQPPVVTINSNSVLCSGSNNTLTASGAATYTWSTGAQAPMIVVTPTNVMPYTVAGTGTNGCIVNSTINVLPSPTLGLIDKMTICQGDQVILNASGAASYTWNTGAQTSSISAVVSTQTSYTVTGSVTGTPCMARATTTINVVPCLGVSSNYAGSLKLTLYPNPAKTELFYTLNLSGVHRYTITDNSGIILTEGEQRGARIRLDVSMYPPGIYNLAVTIGKTSLSKKFLVEK